jgi:hypothetical protein
VRGHAPPSPEMALTFPGCRVPPPRSLIGHACRLDAGHDGACDFSAEPSLTPAEGREVLRRLLSEDGFRIDPARGLVGPSTPPDALDAGEA